jgi:hypothetical protein
MIERITPPRTTLLPSLCLLLLALPFVGCGRSEEAVAADQEAIREVLNGYLPLLAQAYATRDTSPLEGVATPKEINALQTKIGEVSGQGLVFKPQLSELTVEEVDVWSPGNAYVTTLEVWDIAYYALGSDRMLSEVKGQTQRVKYQVMRREGSWQVVSRQVAQTFE